MEKREFFKLDKKARIAMIINHIIVFMIMVGILSVIWKILHSLDISQELKKIDEVITLLLILIGIVFLIAGPTIGYNNYRYRINEKSVEIVKGIFFISREIVPVRRIQQVSVEKGPVLNMFNLANITVVTAGSRLEIEYIPKEKADIIVEKLWKEVNEFAEKQLLRTEEYSGKIESMEEER